MATRTTHTIGTISHGTLRSEDLIPAFLDELDDETAATIIAEYPEYEAASEDEDHEFWTSEEASWMVDALFDALNDVAPPFCYFGANEGDGSDYGFWPSLESAREDEDVLQVSDLAEVPDDATGYVMLVNDHGNVTLYEVQIPAIGKHGFRRARNDLREVWSLV